MEISPAFRGPTFKTASEFGAIILAMTAIAGSLGARGAELDQTQRSTRPGKRLSMLALGADPTGVRDSAAVTRAVLSTIGAGPATLYFPKGTYRFASHGATREECVRVTGSISLVGDGPGKTVFTDDAAPSCMAQFGFFWSMGTDSRDDYSFESDPGYSVNAASAPLGSATIAMARKSDASSYAVGQYVYLRGTPLQQPGEYHGELNVITSVDSPTGVITIAWPLSSDFTQDTGLQLNLVANNEVVTDIRVSGITFAFHDNALLAAQILGLQIFNNEFLYRGATKGNEVSQFNQIRDAEFYDNVVNNPIGTALDVERTSSGWNIHDNKFFGPFDAGEGSSQMNLRNNTITCMNTPTNFCLRFGTTGNTIDNNTVFQSGTAPYGIIDVSGAILSPGTIISNNWIVTTGSRAIVAQTPGTLVTGNTVFSDTIGINVNATDLTVSNNSITLTAPSAICVLIEGARDKNVIAGLSCTGYSTASNKGVYVVDSGPQSGPSMILTEVTGNTLRYGIYVANTADSPIVITNCSFTNTVMPFYP
jgi:hypothetical protein